MHGLFFQSMPQISFKWFHVFLESEHTKFALLEINHGKCWENIESANTVLLGMRSFIRKHRAFCLCGLLAFSRILSKSFQLPVDARWKKGRSINFAFLQFDFEFFKNWRMIFPNGLCEMCKNSEKLPVIAYI